MGAFGAAGLQVAHGALALPSGGQVLDDGSAGGAVGGIVAGDTVGGAWQAGIGYSIVVVASPAGTVGSDVPGGVVAGGAADGVGAGQTVVGAGGAQLVECIIVPIHADTTGRVGGIHLPKFEIVAAGAFVGVGALGAGVEAIGTHFGDAIILVIPIHADAGPLQRQCPMTSSIATGARCVPAGATPQAHQMTTSTSLIGAVIIVASTAHTQFGRCIVLSVHEIAAGLALGGVDAGVAAVLAAGAQLGDSIVVVPIQARTLVVGSASVRHCASARAGGAGCCIGTSSARYHAGLALLLQSVIIHAGSAGAISH